MRLIFNQAAHRTVQIIFEAFYLKNYIKNFSEILTLVVAHKIF